MINQWTKAATIVIIVIAMKTIIIKVTVMIINGYWVINVDSFQVGYYLNFRFFKSFFFIAVRVFQNLLVWIIIISLFCMKKACCMIFFPGDVHRLSYALLVCTISFFDNVVGFWKKSTICNVPLAT